MCSTVAVDVILGVLSDMIAQSKVFTAYDVTFAARKQVPNETVLHTDVRRIIANEFITNQMSNYDRQLMNLDKIDNKSSALVYYPDTVSPYDHPLITDDRASVDDNNEDSDGDGDGDDDSDEKGTIKATAKGRINIPRKLLKQIQPTGGNYDFTICGQLVCRKADKTGRVRIAASTIGSKKCKISLGSNNNSIEIETL